MNDLKLWTWGCGMTAPEFSANHAHGMECLEAVDPVAAVRRGVESGTIEGKLEETVDCSSHHRGHSSMEVFDLDPGTYLVIPVDGCES